MAQASHLLGRDDDLSGLGAVGACVGENTDGGQGKHENTRAQRRKRKMRQKKVTHVHTRAD
jgi:hypothetical protein